jgi:5-methylcytosine-specific restriction endonuclease McrA
MKPSTKTGNTVQRNTEEEYGALLKRPEWSIKREMILKRDGHHCRSCGSANNLQVHHRQYHKFSATGEYKRPWDYNDRYLITLCLDCHKTGHIYFKIPVFTV